MHDTRLVVESSEDAGIETVESMSDEEIICPMCGKPVPADAIECPHCEEPFSPEAIESVGREEKGSKWLFWSGVILVLIGGPGIALGSWLHDVLFISIADYNNFDSFGWANRLVSTVGIIILVIGIILLILSLPKLRPEDEEEEIIEQAAAKEPGPEKIDSTGDQGG